MSVELYFCYLYKNGEFVMVLEDPFTIHGDANLYAKTYLEIRSRKNLTIQVVPVRCELPKPVSSKL